MLSVGIRDEGMNRSVLGLEGRGGAGGARGKMDENEVEDGEAYPGHEEDIDPDALSYIDEKLQDVLGHFQKEFEGGVSAETLGAKFGGYGSFLPAYQRSPSILAQHKSPVKVANHNISKSPYNSQSESGNQSGPVPVAASIVKAIPESGMQPIEKMAKRDKCSMEGVTQNESISKSVSIGDPGSLKVRIKVRPGNVLARNNPDIYSDLGLDVSPSPSLDDSPCESRELFLESPDTLCGSPSTILQIMTCFSVPGGSLLSPLSLTLVHSSEKEDIFLKNIKTCMSQKIMPAAASDTPQNIKNFRDFTYKESNSRENVLALEQAHRRTSEDVLTVLSKNKLGNPAAQDVSSAQDMSLPSSVSCVDVKVEGIAIGDLSVDDYELFGIPKEQNKISMIERGHVSDPSKSNHLEFLDSRRTEAPENLAKEATRSNGKSCSKTFPKEKECGESNAIFQDAFGAHKKTKSKAHKSEKIRADPNRHIVKKDSTSANEEFVKERTAQKGFSSEKAAFKAVQEKSETFESGRMINATQNIGTLFTDLQKESLSSVVPVAPKVKKKSSHVKVMHSGSNPKISKPRKEMNKAHSADPQQFKRDFAVSGRTQQVEKVTHVEGLSISAEKEDSEINKVGNFQIARQATDVQQSTNDAAPKSDAASAIPALVLIQDNWVCCDECQRWRLLPYGTNPDSLPKKWRCSMQTWLPGLNNCNISEDETTKVFHELYQVPAPVSGTNLASHLDAATSTITSAGPGNPVRRLDDMNNASLTGNRKHGFIGGTELLNDSSSTHLLNSSKIVQASSQNKVFNDVGYYWTESDSKAMMSKDGAEEKHRNKQREKLKNMPSYKDGGDVAARPNKPSKPSSKRDINLDGHGSSKKFKKDGSYHSLKDLHSVSDTSGKMAVNSDSNLLEKAPKHVIQSYSDHSSSKDFKSKSASSKMSREQVKFPGKHKELSSSSHAEKLDGYDSNGKKRKLKGWEEKQVFREISMSSEPVIDTNPMIKEELVPGVFRKQKKAKVAKSEGKGSRVLIGSDKVETKDRLAGNTISTNRKHMVDVIDSGVVRSTTEEPMVLYQGNVNLGQALDCVDGVKQNVNYVRPFAAATSSSSKVSGSQKSKSNFPEVRGSPVESVSSSPMRILNTENISKRRNSLMNDNAISIGRPEACGQKQFSDGEVYGTDQMKTRTMDPASTASFKSSDVYQSADCRVLSSLKEPPDYLDTETNCLSRVKGIDGRMVKNAVVVSTDIDEGNILLGDGNEGYHPNKYQFEGSDKDHASGAGKDCASDQNKFINSSCIKLKSGNLDTDADKGKLKVFASSKHNELHPLQRRKGHQVDCEFDHCNLNIKDDLESHSKQQEDHDSRSAIAAPGQSKMSQLENLQHESSHGRQKSPGVLIAEEIDRPVMDSGTATQLSHPVKDKLGKRGPGPQRVPESNKVTSTEQHPVDAINSEALKLSKQSRKLDGQNGTHPNVLRQLNISVPGSSSPMKREGHPSVNSLIKEARELKHKATRLKSIGLDDESSSILFESALKFLYAASLMEPTESESVRQVDLLPSSQMLQMYCETAKFFEFCAHDYERLKKMAAAALAYKCAEVAYFKVAYYKNASASKDRVELQGALDAAVPGESPSSSASDVDNLNNQGGFDKAASAKAASSPQIAGGHAIAAKNRPYVMRLLTFTNHVNCAIEATRKSRNAIAASNVDLGKDGMCSVRKVLDFNFHNVEGLLRLVRQSLNSIGQ